MNMLNGLRTRLFTVVPLVTVTAASHCRTTCKCDSASHVAVVDCGSGYTRVKIFSEGSNGVVKQSSGGRIVRRSTASGRQMPPLHSVLTATDGDVEAWVDALREVLQAEAFAGECAAESIDVLVGATAGVRSALEESKTVRLEDVSALAAIICSRGGLNGGTAKFQLLSGQDEAALELVSARHCLEGSSDEGAALVAASEVVGKGGVGLLSSGGASSQVAFVGKDGKSVRALSLPTHIKKGNSMCLEKGAVRGITEYESYLESLVADLKATECFVGKLKGTFVAIEVPMCGCALAEHVM